MLFHAEMGVIEMIFKHSSNLNYTAGTVKTAKCQLLHLLVEFALILVTTGAQIPGGADWVKLSPNDTAIEC